jgi:hypothetical protein
MGDRGQVLERYELTGPRLLTFPKAIDEIQVIDRVIQVIGKVPRRPPQPALDTVGEMSVAAIHADA